MQLLAKKPVEPGKLQWTGANKSISTLMGSECYKEGYLFLSNLRTCTLRQFANLKKWPFTYFILVCVLNLIKVLVLCMWMYMLVWALWLLIHVISMVAYLLILLKYTSITSLSWHKSTGPGHVILCSRWSMLKYLHVGYFSCFCRRLLTFYSA